MLSAGKTMNKPDFLEGVICIYKTLHEIMLKLNTLKLIFGTCTHFIPKTMFTLIYVNRIRKIF